MNVSFRKATLNDLPVLLALEKAAFPIFQQSSIRSLRLSLTSPFQAVWLVEPSKAKHPEVIGCMTLHLHKRTLRIFSVSVLPEYQGNGIGRKLLKHAENVAISSGFERVSLEADADNTQLLDWYLRVGYEHIETIPDYYQTGKDAHRLVKILTEPVEKNRVSNLIVVDNPRKWKLELENVQIVSSKDYTSDTGFYSRKNLRVFNLCNSYRYQSLGYYVSLLASAREHRAIPNVTTIRDMRDIQVIKSVADDIDESIQQELSAVSKSSFELNVYFGESITSRYKKLAQRIYQLFEAPLFQVQFVKGEKWEIKRLIPLSLNKIKDSDLEKVQEFARSYFESKRFSKSRLKPYKYDLAILVDPKEDHPPSDKKALKLFQQAAEEMDFYTEFITKADLNRLTEFDALFIRETTDVNNHTYQFSRKAYAEGLVVIDDPWSILRCSNKIYLNERLKNNNINTPETRVFFKNNMGKKMLAGINYPLILKQPDSAFSLGVVKVANESELLEKLDMFFKKSELVIGQAFLPSDFDWRIGVLDNQPLFACKYYMAKGHWQIYDWSSAEADPSGDAETLPLEKVPPKVLQVATKAASLMGDGLYGVDLKEVNGKVFVIEVNDNPNIDAGIEDLVLGKELYRKLIQSLISRIEMSRNIARFVSVEPD